LGLDTKSTCGETGPDYLGH